MRYLRCSLGNTTQWKQPYPTVQHASTIGSLSNTEENILRYVAGYVCRMTRHKLNASQDSDKDDMVFYLHEMTGERAKR